MTEQLNKLTKEELVTEIVHQKNQILHLKHQLGLYQKALYGDKREQHKPVDPGQTQLSFEEKVDLDLPQDIEQQQISYKRRKPAKKREDFSKLELPENLERVTTVIEPEGKTEDMVKIGEEVTELLAMTPEKFYVKQIVRPKYATANKDAVIIAPMPSRPLLGAKIDVSLLATILMDKYVYHMPIYRQLQKYDRLGVKLSDSTVGHWAQQGMELLEYLYPELVAKVKSSGYIQADETSIKVLDKEKRGKSHKGYYWVYHDVESGLVLYEYDQGRGQTAPESFLHDYHGYLQTDGYAVYEALKNKNFHHACCMAHARRKFHEAQENDRASAAWMLDKMQDLYQLEEKARKEKLNHQQRLSLRQEHAQPILQQIHVWLKTNQLKHTPKSPMGKAINYTLARWDKLCLYASEGKLEIDNNLVENAIRPIALGRKNYLFAGSHNAARRAGIIYSFITCCKKNDYEPYQWLTDTLSKLPDTKKSELYALLPVAKQDVL